MRIYNCIALISLVLLSLSAVSQHSKDQVYLVNGEYYEGHIVSIGSAVILIRTGDRIVSLNRADISYVFASSVEHQAPGKELTSDTMLFKPLDRIYTMELALGVYSFSKYAVSLQLVQWLRLGDRWAAGLGTSIDFSRYAMARFSLNTRRYAVDNRWMKSYYTLGTGVGIWSGYFMGEEAWDGRSGEFSPIFQANAGAGLRLDTGGGVAVNLEGGLSANRFSLTENFIPRVDGRMATATTDFVNIGPYFRMAVMF